VWWDLFSSAEKEIGILVYSGLFLADDTGLLQVLRERARNGVSVRILLGEPESAPVKQRGRDEQTGEALAARAHNAMLLFRSLLGTGEIEVRTHSTVLYNSVYLTEKRLIVNQHVYGFTAANSPVIEIDRSLSPDMAETFLRSFNRTWQEGSYVAQN
jgi:phosphatidylserine/phosphatidylglycerophosphate/cardiolipin synthase-like enzyme